MTMGQKYSAASYIQPIITLYKIRRLQYSILYHFTDSHTYVEA